ncbi:MAG: hypothetical protein R3302_09505 [Sulfurimonadaceae bacterium]|nr:hypothetical protein [Sulfurimonadaceae bacterium]
MYKVIMERACGCFKRSGDEPVKSFENKDDALIEANAWKNRMNEEYCQKHAFNVVENGDDFLIVMGMRG